MSVIDTCLSLSLKSVFPYYNKNFDYNEIFKSVFTYFHFLWVSTVKTGFGIDMLTIAESDKSVEMCLATMGSPVTDTAITFTVIYESAEEEGKMYSVTIASFSDD